MSKYRGDGLQINESPTATNNFDLSTDGAGGMKIARGNHGATTQDILTIDSSGRVTASQTFSVAPATAAAHAVRSDQLSADNTNFPIYTAPTSWTPVLSFGGASVGMTYSTQQGYYTKAGKLVTGTFVIYLTNKGSSTGTVSVTFPPFTSFSASVGGRGSASCTLANIALGAGLVPQMLIVSDANRFDLNTYNQATGSQGNATDAMFTNVSLITCSFTILTST